jgi:adenylate cyclase
LAAFHAPVGPVAIIAIDDYTCASDWDGCNPVPRSDTATVIDKLRIAGVRYVFLDQIFAGLRPGTDQLGAAIKRAGNVVLAQQISTTLTAESSMEQLIQPIDPLPSDALGLAIANYSCGAPVKLVEVYDLGCMYGGQWYPGVALTLYRSLTRDQSTYKITDSVNLNYAGPPLTTYPEYSYRSIVESQQCVNSQGQHIHCPGVTGSDIWDALRGKTVLLGRTDSPLYGNTDLFNNPLGGAEQMPGVEVQATAFNTLLNHDPIVVLPEWLTVLLIAVLAVLLAAAATALGLFQGLAMGLVALVVYYALTFILLALSNVDLPLVAPEIAMSVSFLLVVGARYTLEEREGRRTRQLLGRFVSPHVADDLVADARGYAMGDRRPIAVLFTDVRGFTTLSERAEPEVVMGALRTYFTRMVKIVLDNGGTVDKYIGDGMMALFGAPVQMADPCLAAMRTALTMQNAMAEVNALLAAPLGAELRIGAGINYGEAVFGLSGAPSKLEFTAIGDTVNTASRLESLCRDKGCGIVISESVYAHLPAALQERLRDLGVVNVKGRQMSLQVYGLAEVNEEILHSAGLNLH